MAVVPGAPPPASFSDYGALTNFLFAVGIHPETHIDQFNTASSYLNSNPDIFYEIKDIADKDTSQRAKDFFKANLPFAYGFDWLSALNPATDHGDISALLTTLEIHPWDDPDYYSSVSTFLYLNRFITYEIQELLKTDTSPENEALTRKLLNEYIEEFYVRTTDINEFTLLILN